MTAAHLSAPPSSRPAGSQSPEHPQPPAPAPAAIPAAQRPLCHLEAQRRPSPTPGPLPPHPSQPRAAHTRPRPLPRSPHALSTRPPTVPNGPQRSQPPRRAAPTARRLAPPCHALAARGTLGDVVRPPAQPRGTAGPPRGTLGVVVPPPPPPHPPRLVPSAQAGGWQWQHFQ